MTEPSSPPETPQKKRIPIVSDLIDLFRVLISPGEVFAEQAAKPAWFGPWIAVSILLVVVGLISAPYTRRIIELSIAAVPEANRAMAMQIGMIIAIVSLPIATILLSLLGALIMWVVLMLTGEKVRYRGLLSASLYAKILMVLQVAVQFAVMKVRGAPAEAIRVVTDAQVSIGADLLLPGDQPVSGFVRVMLGAINPLSIWAVIITVVGIMVMEKQKKGAAWTAVLVSFFIGLLLTGVFAGRSAG